MQSLFKNRWAGRSMYVSVLLFLEGIPGPAFLPACPRDRAPAETCPSPLAPNAVLFMIYYFEGDAECCCYAAMLGGMEGRPLLPGCPPCLHHKGRGKKERRGQRERFPLFQPVLGLAHVCSCLFLLLWRSAFLL